MTEPTAAPLPDTLVIELREQANEAHGVWDYAEELMTRAADRIEAAAALAQRNDRVPRDDARRLDWAEKHVDCINVIGSGAADDKWWEVTHHDGQRSEGGTLRNAIDAAMQGANVTCDPSSSAG